MPLNKGYLTAKDSDEYTTPAFAVKPILKYIKPNSTIWCPFDYHDSQFVKILTQGGHQVIYSHIGTGQDFLQYEPQEDYDYIISNPPFSKKDAILKRLYELNKPFAILMPLNVLQGQRRFKYLYNCQALIFDKRINYYKDRAQTAIQKGVSFASIYLCKDFLPHDLIFEELEVE